MKRLATLALLVGLMMPMTGCYHNQIIVQKDYDASGTVDYENPWEMYLIAGLIPMGGTIDLAQVCPNGAGLIEVQTPFVQGLLSRIVGILISFQEVKVICATGKGELETELDAVASN
jgi:hypothetical protein